jgi:hypothetical protein
LCAGFSPGETARFVIRFWRGATFEEAETNFMVGNSEPFTVQLGGGAQPPATMSTLQGRSPIIVRVTPSIFETSETGAAHFERAPLSSFWPGRSLQKLSADGTWVDLPGENK